jgi:hypothetical protein
MQRVVAAREPPRHLGDLLVSACAKHCALAPADIREGQVIADFGCGPWYRRSSPSCRGGPASCGLVEEPFQGQNAVAVAIEAMLVLRDLGLEYYSRPRVLRQLNGN